MAKEIINIGATSDDGTGDNLHVAGQKMNNNFTELYDEDILSRQEIDAIELINASQQQEIDAIELINASQQQEIDENSDKIGITQQQADDIVIAKNSHIQAFLKNRRFNVDGTGLATLTIYGTNLDFSLNFKLVKGATEYVGVNNTLTSTTAIIVFTIPSITIGDLGVYNIHHKNKDSIWTPLTDFSEKELTVELFNNQSNFNVEYTLENDALLINLLSAVPNTYDKTWEDLIVKDKLYIISINNDSAVNTLILDSDIPFYDFENTLLTDKVFTEGETYQLQKTTITTILPNPIEVYKIQLITSVVGSDNYTLIGKINNLLTNASDGLKSINYVVSGDSTRENGFNLMGEYYAKQLSKINVVYSENALSGQSAYNWKENIGSVNINQAFTLIPNTGKDTILEFSFGINDFKVTTNFPTFDPTNPAHILIVKGYLQDCIDKLIIGKPDLTIILVTPVFTSNALRNTSLQTMYQQLAVENNLYLIDDLSIMGDVHSTILYADGTHPSQFGSERLVNFILDKIVHSNISHRITLGHPQALTPPVIQELSNGIDPINGYWSSVGGQADVATWRRLLEIDIEPNFTLEVINQGNRHDIRYMDAQGVYISTSTGTNTGVNTWEHIIPSNAYKARITLSSDGVNYDLLNDIPSVKYKLTLITTIPTIEEINTGLNLKFPVLTSNKPQRITQPSIGRIGVTNTTEWHSGHAVSGFPYYLVATSYGLTSDITPLINMPNIYIAPKNEVIKNITLQGYAGGNVDFTFKIIKYNKFTLGNVVTVVPTKVVTQVHATYIMHLNEDINVPILVNEVVAILFKCTSTNGFVYAPNLSITTE